MTLGDLWFIIDAIFWVGFFILEGFDFGVGMLHSFLGRNDLERRVLVNTIGPTWDGNEVWLIVAGAVIFAAFPAWYATMFSASTSPWCSSSSPSSCRGLSFEYQRKFDDPRWRSFWRVGPDRRERSDPVPARRRARRPAARAAHQQPPGVHRQLLRPSHPVRPVDRAHAGGPLAARRVHVPDVEDDRRTARASPEGAAAIGVVAIVVTFGFMTWIHVGLGTGLRPRADRGVGAPGGDRGRLGRPREGRGLGLHGGVLGIGGIGRRALQRALSPGS